MEPKFHELLRTFSTFGYFKGHPMQKKVFGNSDNWKIGRLDIWIFGKWESRKLENPSLSLCGQKVTIMSKYVSL